MFFRRKPLSLASLDERLSVVEMALEIRRSETPPKPVAQSGPLDAALAKLQRAIRNDTPGRS